MRKKPVKAYKNLDFMQTPDARIIRVLCELTEPQVRLRRHNIENTLVFFGSARALPKDVAEHNYKKIKKTYNLIAKPGSKLKKEFENAKADLYMAEYYEKARQLAYKIAEWSNKSRKDKKRLVLCTGGGTGIMEAVNRGACEAGGKSIGFNISLPFEQKVNEYIGKDLAFEFHYFFIRKFWFTYLAKALIVFPGGFGTLDEMMEVLTLVQTKKIVKKMPILVFGTDYWNKVINLEEMLKYRAISNEDLKLINFFDDVDEAFNFIKTNLKRYA